MKELNKRQEAQKEALRKKKEAEEEKRRRKERRNALREKRRLQQLQECIVSNLIQTARTEEFNTRMMVYDLRDPRPTEDGFVLIGGFVGELILTFTCLLDYILASPQNQNFVFSPEGMEAYLTDLLTNPELSFSDGICSLNLTKTVQDLTGGAEVTSEQLARLLWEEVFAGNNGLKYLLDIKKDLVLNDDVIDAIFQVISSISLRSEIPLREVPTVPEGADDNTKAQVEKEAEMVAHENEEIANTNKKIALL